MAALKSKKKFKAVMVERNLEEGSDYDINFEAYGRKVEGYVYPKGELSLEKIYAIADINGFKPVLQRECGRVVIRVSYFKAYGWNH